MNEIDIVEYRPIPNSPEIHPALISVLENFPTEEYLRLRNI